MCDTDSIIRCRWCNLKDPLYVKYHDEEWGVPVHDDKKLFEMLILESFQAGLSWETILRKRESFRRAFDGFDAEVIAGYGEEKIASLLADTSIVRNRRKITASVLNARVYLDIVREFGSFDAYIWSFTHGEIIFEAGPANSPLSDVISADLKRRGMSFVGTTIIYAYLQAIGVINSHEAGCYLHRDR